jgi:hypothetical protein
MSCRCECRARGRGGAREEDSSRQRPAQLHLQPLPRHRARPEVRQGLQLGPQPGSPTLPGQRIVEDFSSQLQGVLLQPCPYTPGAVEIR